MNKTFSETLLLSTKNIVKYIGCEILIDGAVHEIILYWGYPNKSEWLYQIIACTFNASNVAHNTRITVSFY